jgi:hypothetical protein
MIRRNVPLRAGSGSGSGRKSSALLSLGGLLLLSGPVGADCTLSGAGTAESPFLIGTYSDLKQLTATFGCDLSKTYLLTADIDASASKGENGAWGFAPIGDSVGGQFTGVFHGGGHAIRHLYMVDSSKAGSVRGTTVGLFGQVNGAVGHVDHLEVADSHVEGRSPGQYVGMIAGLLESGLSIDSCTVTGGEVALILPKGNASNSGVVGGLVGYVSGVITAGQASDTVVGPDNGHVGGIAGSAPTIHHCRSSGIVIGGNRAYAGGIVGTNGNLNASVVDSSSSSSKVTGGISSYAGGISGYSTNLKLDSCLSTGKVVGDSASKVGGISGYSGTVTHCIGRANPIGGAMSSVGGISGEGALVTLSFATGAVTGGANSSVGGLAGVGSTTSRSYANASVSSGKGSKVGGLVGTGSASLYNCYALGSVTAVDSSAIGGLAGDWESTSAIRTCYSLVNVGGASTSLRGQIAGYAPNAEALHWYSYWNTKNTGPTTSLGKLKVFYDTVTAFGLTTDQMMVQSNFLGFNFSVDSAWMMPANSYPVLRGLTNATATGFTGIAAPDLPSDPGPSLIRVGSVAQLRLRVPARVRAVDLRGREVLPESYLAAGDHDLPLPRFRSPVFVQVRAGAATTTLPLGPLD